MMRIVHTFCAFICFGLMSCATAQTKNQATITTDSIADKMLIYQLSNGAWPKQLVGGYVVKYEMPIDDALLAKIKGTTLMHATIDNAATTREINALVKAYHATGQPKYLAAAEKGIDYLLKAQYGNGGWPQYYPDKSSYRAEITYNDNAIVNVLNIMFDITNQTNGFEVVAPSYRSKAEIAYQKGVDCILKTQIIQHGKLSIWAAQYDQIEYCRICQYH
jgi:PelA/Pel-15E family pectate lyase